MNLARAQRFTFDLDLGAASDQTRPTPPERLVPMAEVDALVHAAREEGLRRGRAEGEASAHVRNGADLARAAQTLADHAASFVESLAARHEQLRAEATRLALTIGRKLAAHLIVRHPTGELEALIEEAIANLQAAPHLVIRCHPDLTDDIRQAAEDRIRLSSFSGRLVVMGDPEIGLGDGRLEWVDGGLVRDLGAISDAIDTAITFYLAAHGAGTQEERGQ